MFTFGIRSTGQAAGRRTISILCVVATCQLSLADAPWLSGWTKSPENPILSLSPPGSFDSHNMLSPAVTKYNGTYYIYYSGGPSGPLTGEDYINYQLGLATSTDGVNFTKHGSPILPLGERDNFHVTPALLRDASGELLIEDGKWHMVFSGNRADDVELATSVDGVNWTKENTEPIFEGAYAPSLLKVDDEYWMYYISKPSGKPWEVRLAKGPDLNSLEPVGENPVLVNSQDWERDNLFYPYVMKEGNTWVMFYAAYWDEPGGSGAKTGIGAATSLDGVNWTKNPDNPIITPTPGSEYDSVYTSSQSVIRDGDVYRMFYAGRVNGINKYFSINQATKPIGDGSASLYRWNIDGAGRWLDAANWTGENQALPFFPDGDAVSVVLGGATTRPTSVVLDAGASISNLYIQSDHTYAIVGTGDLHLHSSSSDATIHVSGGDHQLQVELHFDQAATLDVDAGASLALNNDVFLHGHAVTKTGDGQLSINHPVYMDGGELLAQSGAITGSGTLEGSLALTGDSSLSPGNSPGQMRIAGSYSQSSSAILTIELAGEKPGAQHDVLEVGDLAQLDGTLEIELMDDYEPVVGSTFQILQLATSAGRFDEIELPKLAPGKTWDTTRLYSEGVIAVTTIPEPVASSMIAMVAGTMAAMHWADGLCRRN